MADNGWQCEFEHPILLPDRRTLVTLRDAGDYIANLPKRESAPPEWQAAIVPSSLSSSTAARRCSPRIGVLRALNRHHVRDFNPDPKSIIGASVS